MYRVLGQYQRSIKDYDKAIELRPDAGRYFYNRGNAYRGLSYHQRAIEDYDKSIKLDPNEAASTTTEVVPTMNWASTNVL